MRQCLCSDSPRFTVSRFHLSSFPSLSPLLHFSSSLHFFFVPLYTRSSLSSRFLGDARFSPEEASSVYRNESSSSSKPPFPLLSLISVSVSTSRLPSSLSFHLQFRPRILFRVPSLFNGHPCPDFFSPFFFSSPSSPFTSPLLLPRL